MKCVLCKSDEQNHLIYGEFLTNRSKKIGVHTFCLYLSSNLRQRGKDNEGILGFLDRDIREEEQRVKRLNCYYCRKSHAGIGCCEKKCRRTFHVTCGIKNGAQNQFCQSFGSYCHEHVQYKLVPKLGSLIKNELCCICYDPLMKNTFKNSNLMVHHLYLKAPCCQNGYFHRNCLQKFAHTAGYFFKCPLCNDEQLFRNQLSLRGIYIPNQDAAWELEENAYAELLERPNTCNAQICINKNGRDSESNDTLILCASCGSVAQHKKCLLNANLSDRNFQCDDCSYVCGNIVAKDKEDKDTEFNEYDSLVNVEEDEEQEEKKNQTLSRQSVETNESDFDDEIRGLMVTPSVSSKQGEASENENFTPINTDSLTDNINSDSDASNDTIRIINRNCRRNRKHRVVKNNTIFSDDEFSSEEAEDSQKQQTSRTRYNSFSSDIVTNIKKRRRILSSSEEEYQEEKEEEDSINIEKSRGQSTSGLSTSRITSLRTRSSRQIINENSSPIALRTRQRTSCNYQSESENKSSRRKRQQRYSLRSSNSSQTHNKMQMKSDQTIINTDTDIETNDDSNSSVASLKSVRKKPLKGLQICNSMNRNNNCRLSTSTISSPTSSVSTTSSLSSSYATSLIYKNTSKTDETLKCQEDRISYGSAKNRRRNLTKYNERYIKTVHDTDSDSAFLQSRFYHRIKHK